MLCKFQTHGVVYTNVAVVHIMAHNLIVNMCRIPGLL